MNILKRLFCFICSLLILKRFIWQWKTSQMSGLFVKQDSILDSDVPKVSERDTDLLRAARHMTIRSTFRFEMWTFDVVNLSILIVPLFPKFSESIIIVWTGLASGSLWFRLLLLISDFDCEFILLFFNVIVLRESGQYIHEMGKGLLRNFRA